MNTRLSAFVGVCEYLVWVWVSTSISLSLFPPLPVYISIHLAASAVVVVVVVVVTRCGGTGRIINYSRDQIICVSAGVGGGGWGECVFFFCKFLNPLYAKPLL